MRYFIIILVFISSVQMMFGQYVDTIQIIDEDRFPVIGVNVYIQQSNGQVDTSSLTYSDVDGIVVFNDIDYGDYLIFSSVQHHPKKLSIHEIRADKGIVSLQPTMLGVITVRAQSGYDENLNEVPSQVSVISKDQIQLLGPQTSADALAKSGDVFVQKSQMGGGSPIIRGFEANKVLLVLDGVRMNNAIYRSGHLQNVISIDNNALERVEVLHGPASVKYGSDALGGVMHFYTKKPRFRSTSDKPFDLNLSTRFSTSNFESSSHVDLSAGSERFASYTSVSFSSFQDLRAGRLKTDPAMARYWNQFFYPTRGFSSDSVAVNENPNVQIGSAYWQVDAIQKLRWAVSDDVELSANIQFSTSSDVPRYDQLTEGEITFSGGQIQNQTFKYAEWSYGPQQRLLTSIRAKIDKDSFALFSTANITAAFQRIDEDRITRKFNDPLRRFQREDVYVFTLNSDFIKHYKPSSTLSYGFDMSHNMVQSTATTQNIESGLITDRGLGTRYPDGGSTMSSAGIYTSYRLSFLNSGRFIAGMRYAFTLLNASFLENNLYNLPYSSIINTNNALTGSLALNYTFKNKWILNVCVASAYRSPNLDDFGKIRAKGDKITIPNGNLVPEQAVTVEGSISKQFGKYIRFSTTFFHTFLCNAILQQPFNLDGVDTMYYDGDFYDIYANVNAGRANIWGVNGNMMVEFSENSYLRTSINYTRGYELQTNTQLQPLAHIPPLYGIFEFGYKNDLFETRLNVMFNGDKPLEEYADDSSENLDKALPNGTPAWFTINIYTNFSLTDNLKLQFAVENLLDWHYRPYSSGISGSGINVLVSARLAI